MSVGTALSDATFDEFVGSAERPVLVDVWATWCTPCRALDPVLEELAADDDRFVLVSVDADANPAIVRRFDARSVPTLVLIDEGEVVWSGVGARGRARLAEELEAPLSAAAARRSP